jgi:hypothetical protein
MRYVYEGSPKVVTQGACDPRAAGMTAGMTRGKRSETLERRRGQTDLFRNAGVTGR